MAPQPIPEIDGVTAERFRDEILPTARPVVLRGLVEDWPAVVAGKTSPQALAAYLKRFDRGNDVGAMIGSPAIKGRLFYNDDLSGFNFRKAAMKISAALDLLLDHAAETQPAALAIQSVPVRENLPGFESDNRMPVLFNAVEPRVWIGNAVTVAAHHDPSENIACVVAGRRRFTVFPPDQVHNLYVGPFETTPAGPTISLVDFDNPDLDRFPRFDQALATAQVADLEPGDAIFIPHLWWHHVRSTETMNMLANYWWSSPAALGRGNPMEAMFHAMIAIRDLPPSQREAWSVMFDHYVFGQNGPLGQHLPPERRGIQGPMGPAALRDFWAGMSKATGRN